MVKLTRGIVSPIIDRLDRVRGITPEQRYNLRVEKARERYLAKATGPSHFAEINAVFDREIESTRR